MAWLEIEDNFVLTSAIVGLVFIGVLAWLS
jgi:hypothetical protein